MQLNSFNVSAPGILKMSDGEVKFGVGNGHVWLPLYYPIQPLAKPHATVMGCSWYYSPSRQPNQAAFLTQALHQPLAATCLPANSGQGPAASLGLPAYSWQLLHICSLVCLAYFFASTLVVSAA